MQRVNIEGLYATIQSSLPLFEKNSWQGRIIIVSPPIYSRFFRGKAAYAIGKVGMSVLTKGLAVDFERQGRKGMSVTSIWPASAIQSAATEMNPASSGVDGSGKDRNNERLKDLRKPVCFIQLSFFMLSSFNSFFPKHCSTIIPFIHEKLFTCERAECGGANRQINLTYSYYPCIDEILILDIDKN